jgi:hypothetical protein
MTHTDAYYEFPGQLFRAHDAKTPKEYAREAYKRTSCGVWTTFLTMDESIPSADLTDYQNTIEWATRHCIGVKHGTIVEGSDAEFEADALLFPFEDKELSETWEYLEERVDEYHELL